MNRFIKAFEVIVKTFPTTTKKSAPDGFTVEFCQ